MSPCPSVISSWWAPTLEQKSFLVLHFVLLVEKGFNLFQPSHHPFQIFCSFSVWTVFLYFVSLADVLRLLIKVHNNPDFLNCLWEIPLSFPQYWWFPFQQLCDHFPVNLVLYGIPMFVLIFVSFLWAKAFSVWCCIKSFTGAHREEICCAFPIQEVRHFKEKTAQISLARSLFVNQECVLYT